MRSVLLARRVDVDTAARVDAAAAEECPFGRVEAEVAVYPAGDRDGREGSRDRKTNPSKTPDSPTPASCLDALPEGQVQITSDRLEISGHGDAPFRSRERE